MVQHIQTYDTSAVTSALQRQEDAYKILMKAGLRDTCKCAITL